MTENEKRISKAINRIRKSQSNHPPKVKQNGNHVRVGSKTNRLSKNFKSSGEKRQ
jgi:hypothetical protein